ncbi:MAG: sigma-70 family RNA polymerase sigma factor [Clostridia bacterium]|nr:sigma-70 family RNA polymerase sigma factor [Clostridia bacterium]
MYDAKALLAGEETALADAIDTLSPELYRYAAGILLNRPDAEDAVQSAFVALWQHRSAVKEPEAVRAYLYRCTYRAAVDLIRKSRLFVPLPEVQNLCPLSDDMKTALSRLSPVERAIVYERAVMETPYAELAAHLGLREDNVRKKYERARKKLAAYLPEAKDGGNRE